VHLLVFVILDDRVVADPLHAILESVEVLFQVLHRRHLSLAPDDVSVLIKKLLVADLATFLTAAVPQRLMSF